MLEQINAQENSILDTFKTWGYSGYKKHSEDGIMDALSFSTGDPSANNLATIKGQTYSFDPTTLGHIQNTMNKLEAFLVVKQKIYEGKREIQEDLVTRVADESAENDKDL